VLNARSVVKLDAFPALYADIKSNNIDVCWISETWLNHSVCDSLICPPGYSILRKDRTNRRGGGVAMICRNDWKMESLPNLTNDFECLWRKITTVNSIFYVAIIYHPPDHTYNPDDFVDSGEQLLSATPNTKIIMAGDLNKLNISTLLNQLSLFQMVKTPTRGNNILDVFITNTPHYWKKIKVAKSLVRSDHKMIIAYPREVIKTKRTYSYFRDVRHHRKLDMWRELEDVDWNEIRKEEQSVDEMVEKLYNSIWPKFEKSFPMIKVRTSTRDPPFMSRLVRHLLKQRKRAIKARNSEANTRLQGGINDLIHKNQLNAVRNENRKYKSGSKAW
jgi:hypothetical protein